MEKRSDIPLTQQLALANNRIAELAGEVKRLSKELIDADSEAIWLHTVLVKLQRSFENEALKYVGSISGVGGALTAVAEALGGTIAKHKSMFPVKIDTTKISNESSTEK